MNNEFSLKIKRIEDELLALKTNSRYALARGFEYASPTVASTGIYRITFEAGSEAIFSTVTASEAWRDDVARIQGRTPGTNTQDIEVAVNPNYTGTNIRLSVISNRRVVSIDKIS